MIRVLDAYRFHVSDDDINVVLCGVTLTVTRSDRIGIYGPQSSGKSTLARLACRIERPDRGQVLHSGRVSWPLGFSGFLHLEMTGEENVAVAAGLAGETPDRAIAFVQAFTGLGGQMRHRLRTYSPACKARLAMGCSFAFPADIYVADDTIAVGDEEFQNRCFAELHRRMAVSGLLLVSKNRRHLEKTCRRYLALRSGKLVAASSAEEAEAIGQAGKQEQAA